MQGGCLSVLDKHGKGFENGFFLGRWGRDPFFCGEDAHLGSSSATLVTAALGSSFYVIKCARDTSIFRETAMPSHSSGSTKSTSLSSCERNVSCHALLCFWPSTQQCSLIQPWVDLATRPILLFFFSRNLTGFWTRGTPSTARSASGGRYATGQNNPLSSVRETWCVRARRVLLWRDQCVCVCVGVRTVCELSDFTPLDNRQTALLQQ